jgi:aconitate hydratase 2/2-methylisocitrate dehydratase
MPSGSLPAHELAEKITVTVFKVTGETNTDDLSPAPDAWSRPDIPLHALAMLKNEREGIEPDRPGAVGPIKQIEQLSKKGFPLAYVGDVVGTGSSRKSATNSVLWFMGDDIPNVPNKRRRRVWYWAARLRRFSSTPWKMPVRCRSKSTSAL